MNNRVNNSRWRRLAGVGLLLAAAVTVAVCGGCSAADTGGDGGGGGGYEAEDCDRGDLAEFDSDCGYWQSGGFVYWWWVDPRSGGIQPYGWTAPPLPPGASYTRPRNQTGAPATSRQTAPKGAPPPATVGKNGTRTVPGVPASPTPAPAPRTGPAARPATGARPAPPAVRPAPAPPARPAPPPVRPR